MLEVLGRVSWHRTRLRWRGVAVRLHRLGWIWVGRIAAVLVLVGLGVYLLVVGLDKGGKIATVLGPLVAVAALAAPYLLPSPERSTDGETRTRGRWPRPNFDLPGDQEQQRFVGRDRELSTCKKKLEASHLLIIYGLDGAGKTTLARVYAARNQGDYDLMWRVPASHESSVTRALGELAIASGVATTLERDFRMQLVELQTKLRGRHRWLLIFDDVHDWESTQDYISGLAGLGGHVIVTTWSASVSGAVQDLMPDYLKLRGLPPAEAREYLTRHIAGASKADAERLAKDLGYLPSALEFACKRLATEGIPETSDTKFYNDVLGTLWQATIDRLQNESSLAYSLLELCSLFASDPIPEAILNQPSRGPEPPGELRAALIDRSKYTELIRRLRDLSLLTRTAAQTGDGEITVHRLVQIYLRGNIPHERRRDRLVVAIDILLDTFYESWFKENFRRCALALPHAEACLDMATQDEGTAGDAEKKLLHAASKLMGRIANYHRTRGDIFKARDFHERALRLWEKLYGPGSLYVARTLMDLGVVLTEMGDLDKARATLERSLGIETSAESPNEEQVAICRDNLGIAWAASGDYARAIELHKLAYDFWIAENPKHSNAAEALDNMGHALYLVGDFAAAEKVLCRAVDIGEAALGTGFDKLALAGMRHNLGQLRRAQGSVYDAWRAKPVLEKALAVRTGEWGDQHLSVIDTRTTLARVLRCLGEYVEAGTQVVKAREALDANVLAGTLGVGPPGSQELSSRYECALLTAEGELSFALGNYVEAQHSLQRAQELAKSSMPLPPVERAELMENLGRVCNAQLSGNGEHWVEEAAETRLTLHAARARVPTIPEEADR
jgi:tetratricopeptide (TPR) repeat protein